LTENSEIVEDAAIIAYEYVAGPLTVKTHEWFGSGGGSAGRPILISQRVKHIIERMKWKGLTLVPQRSSMNRSELVRFKLKQTWLKSAPNDFGSCSSKLI